MAFLWESGVAVEQFRRRARRLSLGLGGALLAAVFLFSFFKLDWRWNAACKQLAFALLSVWLVDRAAEGFRGVGRWLLGTRPMVYVGSISYGIYLYHEFIPAFVSVFERRLGVSLPFPMDGGGRRFLAVTGVTLAVAALSWHWFEKPLNDLKSRFPYLRKERWSFRTTATRTVGSGTAA